MKNFLIIAAFLLLAATAISADLLDCEEQKLKETLKQMPGIGSKIASDEEISGEHEVRDFFKNLGCKIKEGASKVSEGAKKLGSDLKESAKKLGEKAKDLGADIKTKINNLKDKMAKDTSSSSSEELTDAGRRLVKDNVEIIDPEILKGEQQCGHGHILDALGNCSKLRK